MSILAMDTPAYLPNIIGKISLHLHVSAVRGGYTFLWGCPSNVVEQDTVQHAKRRHMLREKGQEEGVKVLGQDDG